MQVQKSLRVAHTSSILISVVINALLVVALLTMVTLSQGQQRETTTVMVIDPTEQEQIDEIEEELEPEEPVDPEDLDQLVEDFNIDMNVDTEFEPDQEAVEDTTQTEVSSLTDLMSDVSSPVVMTGLLVGRTPKARAAAMRRYGNGLEKFSEPAVMKALEWLRDHQHQNGAWAKNGETTGNGFNAGYTGLALLTFLAHGETPSSAEFGPTVARGIRFLVENQRSDGVFQPAGGHTGYGHAMATYALAEAYTMTENPLLREPLQRAVEVIINGQQPNGGYDYDYKKEARNDLSYGAWQVQALKAASIAGVGDVNRIDEFKSRGMDGMLVGSNTNENGRFFAYSSMNGNRPGRAHAIVTSAGTLCLFLSGRGRSEEARDAVKYLEAYQLADNQLPEWGNQAAQSGHGGVINKWYYTIQAFFQANPDGADFKKYMAHMVRALAQNQASDGHWMCYSEHGERQGKTYNTTLAALGLMVYYRHLPTTQAENIHAPAQVEPPVQEDEGEVGFSI